MRIKLKQSEDQFSLKSPLIEISRDKRIKAAILNALFSVIIMFIFFITGIFNFSDFLTTWKIFGLIFVVLISAIVGFIFGIGSWKWIS